MLSKDQQWIKSTLSHISTGRVPYHFDFTPPARAAIEDHYGRTDIEDILDLPIRWGGPKSRKPLYAATDAFGKTAIDEFGVKWIVSDNDRGAPVPCITMPDLSDYTFPDPYASYRFEDLGCWCTQNSSRYRVLWIGDLWERAGFMRGIEDLLIDTITGPSFVKELLRRITDYILATMEVLNERCDFEGFALSDDYGTQKDLMLSPNNWRNIIKPFLVEISDAAKRFSKDLMLHSCGNISRVIGDLIDIGIDIIHPIQPETMDIYALKAEYGKDVTFQGGLDTQHLLPAGSPEEIKTTVRILKDKMGRGGGYILEPGITIQGDVPLENMIAMIEETRSTK
jgi:uroporphyrinogen decarboxylase